MTRFNECFDDSAMPELSSASTLDEQSSLEEFPLHPFPSQSSGRPNTPASIDHPGTKRAEDHAIIPRPKRFSLRAITRPIVRAARGVSSNAAKADTTAKEALKLSISEPGPIDDAALPIGGKLSSPFKKSPDTGEPLSPPLASAMTSSKSHDVKLNVKEEEGRRNRRVSFSPSVEDNEAQLAASGERESGQDPQSVLPHSSQMQRSTNFAAKGVRFTTKGLRIKRSLSFDDSIGRAKGRMAAVSTSDGSSDDLSHGHRRRRSGSFSFSTNGIQYEPQHTVGSERPVRGKGEVLKPRVSRKEAIAARHARVLERIINAGTSIELEELKAKRAKKLGTQHSNVIGLSTSSKSTANVQQYPVVAPHKVKALKKALMDHDMANGIIGELRVMEVDPQTLIGAVDGVNDLADPGHADNAVDSEAHKALNELADRDVEERRLHKAGIAHQHEKRKVQPSPLRAVCLNVSDEEVIRRRHPKLKETESALKVEKEETNVEQAVVAEQEIVAVVSKDDPTAAEVSAVAVTAAEVGALGTAIKVLGDWFKPALASMDKAEATERVLQYSYEIKEDIRAGDVKETLADTVRLSVAGLRIAQPVAGVVAEHVEGQLLPANKVPISSSAKEISVMNVSGLGATDLMLGVSPVSLLVTPGTAMTALGAQQSGVFDALANASGAAVAASKGGYEAMQLVQPPLDRMAVFVYWWGFELTLPEPSMKNLDTVRSVSGAFLGFLQTMVTSGGVPELLPFVRYIASFMDMEFSAIKAQDRDRRGVVIAATWLMPFALVPRPWDYGTGDNDTTKKTPAFVRRPASSASPAPPQLEMPAGGLPLFPARISSANAATLTQVTPSKETKNKSSQERHFAQGQKAAIAGALLESPPQHVALLPRQRSGGVSPERTPSSSKMLPSSSSSGSVSALDSVQEMPESGSTILSRTPSAE